MKVILIFVAALVALASGANVRAQPKDESQITFHYPPENLVKNVLESTKKAGARTRSLAEQQQRDLAPLLSFVGSLPSLITFGQTVVEWAPSVAQHVTNAGSGIAGWMSGNAATLLGAVAGATAFASTSGGQAVAPGGSPAVVPAPTRAPTMAPTVAPVPVPVPVPAKPASSGGFWSWIPFFG